MGTAYGIRYSAARWFILLSYHQSHGQFLRRDDEMYRAHSEVNDPFCQKKHLLQGRGSLRGVITLEGHEVLKQLYYPFWPKSYSTGTIQRLRVCYRVSTSNCRGKVEKRFWFQNEAVLAATDWVAPPSQEASQRQDDMFILFLGSGILT